MDRFALKSNVALGHDRQLERFLDNWRIKDVTSVDDMGNKLGRIEEDLLAAHFRTGVDDGWMCWKCCSTCSTRWPNTCIFRRD